MAAASANGLKGKLDSLRQIYQARHKRGLLLEQQNNIAWLLRGRSHVNLASVNGIVNVVVNDAGVYLVTTNIEAQRLITEEFPGYVEVHEYNWYEPRRGEVLIYDLTDGEPLRDSECEPEMKVLRTILSASEQSAYAALGGDVAYAVQQTCLAVLPGQSEHKIAAQLAAHCLERAIEPVVLLVAADERVMLYRHPLPTAKCLKDYLMLAVCGRRYGQIASLTRFVAFASLPTEILYKRDAVHNLDAMLESTTRPGAKISAIFAQLLKQYRLEGFPDEWKLHHQGGMTGYNSREWRADFTANVEVKAGQVYAWNPSITGFKAEDTFIVGQFANQLLTATPELPTRSFPYNGAYVTRSDILLRRKLTVA